MVHLLSIPENVMIQHVFPSLDHNDLLSLRRVSKQTKAFADAYLWMPLPGHQGKWELKIDTRKKDKTLESFLQLDVPPPSRLYIVNRAKKDPLMPRSFFKDELLDEFMDRYSKYVTKLRLNKLFYRIASPKEIGFYESLVNLEKLCCSKMITVRDVGAAMFEEKGPRFRGSGSFFIGPAKFEKRTRRAEGSLLIPPWSWSKKLKILKLGRTDCMASMWNFINGVSNNLEELLHPFQPYVDGYYTINLSPVRELIERRRGMKHQSKLVYDWNYLVDTAPGSGMELNGIYSSCRDNGVMIKNLDTRFLDCLLCDENGRIDENEIVDPLTGEWILNSRVNYQRNLCVGSVIHSLVGGMTDNVFLMELPALEEISIFTARHLNGFKIRRRHGHEYPQWPNLRKMDVRLDQCGKSELRFLFADIRRPKLEELCLIYRSFRYTASSLLPCPRKLGECCGNLKRLTIDMCTGNNDFFVGLWEELPLLEDVTLEGGMKLTDNCFIGRDKSRPAFLKLKKLKHLAILNLDRNRGITDTAFKNVFRHLELSSFKLSSDWAIKKITVNGIIKLFTGPFKKTIEKLDLNELQLEDVSRKQLMGMVSCLY